MPDDLCLPVIAMTVLLWYLVCAIRQIRSETVELPHVVWREAAMDGWTEWCALPDVSASAGYDAILDAVRERAATVAAGVQFAIVTRPPDAPAFTLRVLFMSAVRERFAVRDLALAAGAC